MVYLTYFSPLQMTLYLEDCALHPKAIPVIVTASMAAEGLHSMATEENPHAAPLLVDPRSEENHFMSQRAHTA